MSANRRSGTFGDVYERRYVVDGEERQFFTIGALAEALNRSSGTIRRWEREGVLPAPTYRRQSRSHRGERRLYTGEQIDLLATIARRTNMTYSESTPDQRQQFIWLATAAFRSPELPAHR